MAGFTIIATLLVLIFNTDAKPRGSIVPDRLETTDDSVRFPGKLIPISTLRSSHHGYNPIRFYGLYSLYRNRYPIRYDNYRKTTTYGHTGYSPFDDSYLYPTYLPTKTTFNRGYYDDRSVQGYLGSSDVGIISGKSHRDGHYSRDDDSRVMHHGGYSVGRDDYASRDYLRKSDYNRGPRKYQYPSKSDDYSLNANSRNNDQSSTSERDGMSSRRDNDPSYYYRLLTGRDNFPGYGNRQTYDYVPTHKTYPVPSDKYPSYLYRKSNDRDDYYPVDDRRKHEVHSSDYHSENIANRADLGRRFMDLDVYPDYGYQRKYDYRSPSDDRRDPSNVSPYLRDDPRSSKRRRDFPSVSDDFPVYGSRRDYTYLGSTESHKIPDMPSYYDEYHRRKNPFSQYSFIGIRNPGPVDGYTSSDSRKNYVRYHKDDDQKPRSDSDYLSYRDPYPTKGRLPDPDRNVSPHPADVGIDRYAPYPSTRHRDNPRSDDGVSISLSNRFPSSDTIDPLPFSTNPTSPYDHGTKQNSYNQGHLSDDYHQQPFSSNPNSPFDHGYRRNKNEHDHYSDNYHAQPFSSNPNSPYDHGNRRGPYNYGPQSDTYYKQPFSSNPHSSYDHGYYVPPRDSYTNAVYRGSDPYPKGRDIIRSSVSSNSDTHHLELAQAALKDKLIAYDRILEEHRSDRNPAHRDYDAGDRKYGADYYREPKRTVDLDYAGPGSQSYSQVPSRGYETKSYRDSYLDNLAGHNNRHSDIGYAEIGGKSRDVEYATVMHAEVYSEPPPSPKSEDGTKYATTLDARPIKRPDPEPPASRSSACCS